VPQTVPTIYSANITKGSLKLRESRILASLLLSGVKNAKWKEEIEQNNILQARSCSTAKSLAGFLRARLEQFDSPLWLLVRDGDRILATQALLACAVKHSPLLGDFMDLKLRDEYRKFTPTLPANAWSEFLEECHGRDPGVSAWHESTRRRLRSTVFQILAQAGYLSDTYSRELRVVTLLPELTSYLRDKGESHLLRCLNIP
jgi:hypothetical protein